ncbi:MAG: 50S ribosomal protein L22 [Chloroflexi bacterium]|jgi:large subunit ribosomal protein L22|nr:50S ribosomal protein L22 [Chloroflexota bacterium]
MTQDIRAHARNIQISQQKARLVVDLVRGEDALTALDTLRFLQNKAAKPVAKVIASAMANAEENFGISRNDLYIYRIFADQGPTRKWRRFGARGRFKPLLRRSSHITVVLREREA